MRLWSFGTYDGADVWLNTDPCGIICGSVTLILIAFAMYTTNTIILFPWYRSSPLASIVNLIIFNSLCILAAICHVLTMTTDPGAVPKDALPLALYNFPNRSGNNGSNNNPNISVEDGTGQLPSQNNSTNMTTTVATSGSKNEELSPDKRLYQHCKKCKVYKPKRAHHCSQCRRCIIKMDHHCPWVNNCVGINNHKLFILFLLYTFTSCFYCLILVICYSWGNVILDDENTGSSKHNTPQLRGSNRNHVLRTHPEPPSMGTVFLVFVVVEAILFGLFTCCMLTEQWSNVVDNNETTVERIIRERNEKQRKEKEMLLHHEAGSDDSDIISSDSHGEEKKQSVSK